ncbi:MAG: UDP-N-acetylmuramoyl-L-alanyl-D-glutamate--2,6-diaminopimelate ligase [Lachnospiraceae bacterium]|nr:UDP-N-acetylmuramoyl-L-alanyl-D-glutamate--2,6-diaminopimelate ligase [Lachnospiraceae bacterium]
MENEFELRELLKGLEYEVIKGEPDKRITKVVYDSRKLEEGCLFVCVKGANFDGHSKALEAADKKAAALVVSEDVDTGDNEDITVVKVKDTRYAMALISAASYSHPADRLKVIGITGTKGKTTTAYLVKSMLENAGYKVGLVGTIEIIIGDEHIPAFNTTPESYVLQEYFDRMVKCGIEIVVMEVSSQGLMLHRTAGINFELGIFTNIEPDHIGPNEHKDFDDYLHCKSLLFRQCRVGIINGDDKHAEAILRGHTCRVETFGLYDMGNNTDLYAENIELTKNNGKLSVEFDTGGLLSMHALSDIPGRFSVYNSLCAIAVCRHFNVDTEDIKKALLNAKVKGRVEMVRISGDYCLIIDYAHNAMALESLLSTLREYKPGRLVCLFGCGGNRARSRRFEMGEVSGRLSDLTIITSDNPRFEEPLDIIADIETGIKKTTGRYVMIPDRYEAVKYAIENAEKGDVIVLAGKGHEDYQEIKGVKHHMDERELISRACAELGIEYDGGDRA